MKETAGLLYWDLNRPRGLSPWNIKIMMKFEPKWRPFPICVFILE
jgi:hypothetical protein